MRKILRGFFVLIFIPLLVGVILLALEHRTSLFQGSPKPASPLILPVIDEPTNELFFQSSEVCGKKLDVLTDKLLSQDAEATETVSIEKGRATTLFGNQLSIAVTYLDKSQDKVDVIVSSPGCPPVEIKTRHSGSRISYGGIAIFDIFISELGGDSITVKVRKFKRDTIAQPYLRVLSTERATIELGSSHEFFSGELSIGLTFAETFDPKVDFVVSSPSSTELEVKTQRTGSRFDYKGRYQFDIFVVETNANNATFDVSLLE